MGQNPRSQAGLSPRLLDAVVGYVDQNIASDLSLRELASISGMSASYFRVLFKRALGISVHQYIMRRRIDHAMRLLSRRSIRLCQVALESGFTDQSHMARCMRRMIGITPAALLKQFGNNAA